MINSGVAPVQVEVVKSLGAYEQDDRLTSPDLLQKLGEYTPGLSAMWDEFEASHRGSAEEMTRADRLAKYYLLRTSYDLLSLGHDPAVQMPRFTERSIELYGAPAATDVAMIAAQTLPIFEAADSHSFATQVYRELAVAHVSGEFERGKELVEPFASAFRQRFEVIFDVTEQLHDGPYDMATTRAVFSNMIGWLALDDSEWRDWEVVNDSTVTRINVRSSKKQIVVPDGRQPISCKAELQALLAHEVGVHAARAVNGYRLNDPDMANGLYNYGDFEEGLGKLVEQFFDYHTTSKEDRYINIALALGVGGVRLDRRQLLELSAERVRLHAVHDSEDPSPIRLQQETDGVNRIFRGTTGQAVYAPDGSIQHQAVLTKDIAYYVGYKKAWDFVAAQLAAGRSANEVLDYLLLGKFDPTTPLHAEYTRRYQVT